MNKHYRLTVVAVAALLAGPTLLQASPPSIIHSESPSIPARFADANGDVVIEATVNEQGYVTGATITETFDPKLGAACLSAFRSWRFAPAIRDGQPTVARVKQPFRFGEGTLSLESHEKVNRPVSVARRSAPDLPDSLRNIHGQVRLLASIDAEGKISGVSVEASSHSELEPIAHEIVRDWSFRPAIHEGQPVASKVIIPIHFQGNRDYKPVQVVESETSPTEEKRSAKKPSADRDLKVLRRPFPELADDLQNLAGSARIAMLVDEYGYVARAEIASTDNPALAEHARAAVEAWKFKPAIRGGQPVAQKVIQPFVFDGEILESPARPEAPMIAQKRQAAESPVRVEKRAPRVLKRVKPECPASLARVDGYVNVRIRVSPEGEVLSAFAQEASHEELVDPTLTALSQWRFSAIEGSNGEPSELLVPVRFR